MPLLLSNSLTQNEHYNVRKRLGIRDRQCPPIKTFPNLVSHKIDLLYDLPPGDDFGSKSYSEYFCCIQVIAEINQK